MIYYTFLFAKYTNNYLVQYKLQRKFQNYKLHLERSRNYSEI